MSHGRNTIKGDKMKAINVLEIPQDLPVRTYGKMSNNQRIQFWLYVINILWIAGGGFITGWLLGSGK
jgi:hypothetical protein